MADGDVLVVDGSTLEVMRFSLLNEAERNAEDLASHLERFRDTSSAPPRNEEDRRKLDARLDDVVSTYGLLRETMAALEQVGVRESA